MISNEAVEAAVREVDRFVYKPPADELPSVEGHKNALMRAVLEAAAPYMLPAPEGVSEAEKRMGELIQVIDSGAIPGISTPVLREDLNNILLALSSERERAERLAEERERLHLLICGGEDAPGYAASLTFDEVKAAHDDYIAMLKSNAQAAEAKVKELEAPFDWTAEDLVDLMAEAIMDAIDMDTNATDYARAALIALNKEGLLRPSDYREPDQ